MPHADPSSDSRAVLEALSNQFPTSESAIAELAALSAQLSLRMGVVHVISDVHGEDEKLRHVINNASGALRQLVDKIVGDRLPPAEKARFLAVLYYPREALNAFSKAIVEQGDKHRVEWDYSTLTLQFEIVRELRKTCRRRSASSRTCPAACCCSARAAMRSTMTATSIASRAKTRVLIR